MLQGSYAGSPPFPYDAAFDRELQLIVPRDCRRADIQSILGLMGRSLLDPLAWVEDVQSPACAADMYARLQGQISA
ncbi:MAG: hypothetical protein LR015_15020, partial [Verrucomicrobia bacterium]|nr:hypothetical protein [Verrucomicrobiota bacterium]